MKLPLIERNVGEVTYEHCLPQGFYGNQYICSAERNLYVDKYHEVCLLAHYGFRIKGKYEIVPECRYYITDERQCLSVYWGLGEFDKNSIIEEYDSLEKARSSKYYSDFCDLQVMIDKGLEWSRQWNRDVFNAKDCICTIGAEVDGVTYDGFQYVDCVNREYIQLYINPDTHELEKMSSTKVNISDLLQFFKDFDELDAKDLHLRTWIDIDRDAMPKKSKYHKAIDFLNKDPFARDIIDG